MELTVDNVNEAFSEIFWKFKVLDSLTPQETRNGPALVYPEMVTTIYRYPEERVLFHPGRDANPIFHLMEAIWMLAGSRDVAFVKQFNKKISDFSDDGVNFNAAYGWRWRQHFGHDQLIDVIDLLRADPNSRQAVLQMWDSKDLFKNTIDKACNTQLVFQIIKDQLHMTVFNRSNDLWWGAYGANAVHFSFLQEFVAHSLGVSMGRYNQVSVNFHLYTELYNALPYLECPPSREYDYYQVTAKPLPIIETSKLGWSSEFLTDCETFCKDPYNEKFRYFHSFFNDVALPMALIYKHRKSNLSDGMKMAERIEASDWKIACINWINRRQK